PSLVQAGGGEICGVAVDSLSSPLNPPPSSEPISGSGGSSNPPPPAPGPPTPGTVHWEKVKYDKKHGTARVILTVNEAGTVSLTGKGVAAAKATAAGAGTVTLTVRAAKAKRLTLRQLGRLVTRLTVSFTPSGGGSPASTSKPLTLRQAH